MFKVLFKYAPVQIISSTSIFLLIAIQARYLSTSEYGLLAVIIVVLELVRMAGSQWVNAAMLRLHPSLCGSEKNKLAANALFIIWIFFIPSAGILVIGLYSYNNLSFLTGLSAFILLLFKTLYMYHLEISRLNDDIRSYRTGVMINAIVSLFGSFCILNIWPGFVSAIASLALGYISALIFLKPFKEIDFNWCFCKRLINYGFPLMFSGTISVLSSKADRLVMADALGLADTGVYAAQSNLIFGAMSLVFMVVALPLYPSLTCLSTDRSKLLNAHSNYLDILLAITFPALIGLCLVAEPLVSLFLKDDYLSSGLELFWVLALAAFIYNLKAHYIDHGLQFLLKTKLLPLVSLFFLVANVTLLLLLINILGVIGAAWSLLITSILALLLTAGLAYKQGYIYSFGPNIFKIILSTSIMGLVIYMLDFYILNFSALLRICALVLVGVLSYFISSLLMNSFGCYDLIKKRWFS